MKNAGFKWTKKRSEAAIKLSTGHTIEETAADVGVAVRTIYNWKAKPEFAEEVDRLSLMTDIASRAERLRIAKRLVRQKGYATQRDLLDWLKYAQSETDGVKLDLAALAEVAAPLAGAGSDRDGKEGTAGKEGAG